tara:strand:+ start:2020 stop:2232 length:213 start_codon:yes stop_codon:yes gene_type:complete
MYNMTNTENISAEGVSLVIGGVAAAIASIVYSLKHVKHSSCCLGFVECDQKVVVEKEQETPNPLITISEV